MSLSPMRCMRSPAITARASTNDTRQFVRAIGPSSCSRNNRQRHRAESVMRRFMLLGVLGLAVLTATNASAQLAQKRVITLTAARKMVAAAEAEAERNHWAGVIAVVDDGGWPILVE